MLIGGFDVAAATWPWLVRHWPDVVNGIFVAFVAGGQWSATRHTVQQEEAAEDAARVILPYFCWSLFTVPYFYFVLVQPISAAMYAVLGATQAIFLSACWVYGGTFNFDRRRDRARWAIIRIMRRIFGGQLYKPMPKQGPTGLLGAFEYAVRADLPIYWCDTCARNERHDLDGHCMVCDRGPI